MAAGVVEDGPRRYAGYHRPKRPGVLGFGLVSTVVAGAGVVVAILVIAGSGGVLQGTLVVALTFAALAPTRRSGRDGRTTYERLWKRLANRANRADQRDVMYSGPVGFLPDGKCRLPGLLAASELISAADSHEQPYGVLFVKSTLHYTVVFECSAEGQELNDQETVDQQVAHWGQFLAELGDWADVDGAQVVVETAPDPGDRLQAQITSRRSADAPPFATEVMDSVARDYPAGSSTVSTRVSLTFSASSMSESGQGKPTDRTEMLASIGNRIPTILGTLRVTGAGQAVRVMQARDLTDAVRVAFDPSVASTVEEARRTEGGTGLTWDEAGPVRWVPYGDCVHHDRAWSTSYQMLRPPKGAVYSDVLQRLLAPHPDLVRKRVAILYRPQDSVTAGEVVERDLKDAEFTAKSGRRVTARASADLRAASQASQEEALGAGLVRFGMVITATVDRREDLPRARETVRRLQASARLKTREALGNQEVAFTAGLPCGLVLPKHMRVPADLQDVL